MEELPDYENIYIPSMEIDESGFAYDGKTGEPLGQMFGDRPPPNYITRIKEDERYEVWLECSCGYDTNSVLATFCGGCGHRVSLPDSVRAAWDQPGVHLAGERAMVCLGVAKFRTHQDCADAGTQSKS